MYMHVFFALVHFCLLFFPGTFYVWIQLIRFRAIIPEYEYFSDFLIAMSRPRYGQFFASVHDFVSLTMCFVSADMVNVHSQPPSHFPLLIIPSPSSLVFYFFSTASAAASSCCCLDFVNMLNKAFIIILNHLAFIIHIQIVVK